jgi:hypothetical protein
MAQPPHQAGVDEGSRTETKPKPLPGAEEEEALVI